MKIFLGFVFFCLFEISFASQDECPFEDLHHKYLSVPIDFENPSAGSYKLHYKLFNRFNSEKKTLFLLHGGPGDSIQGFERCLGGYCFHQLNDEYNVVAIDQRGAGCSNPPSESNSRFTTIRSTSEDIVFLKNYLVGDRGKVSLFGFSFGSVVAMVIAANHPHSVDRLILEGSLLNNKYMDNLPETISETLDNLYQVHPEVRVLNNSIEEKIEKKEIKISYSDFEGIRDLFAMYSYDLLFHLFPRMLGELNEGKFDLYSSMRKQFDLGFKITTTTPAYKYIMCREIFDFQDSQQNRFTINARQTCGEFIFENPMWKKWNALNFTDKISAPALIIVGETDSVTASYNASELKRNIFNSTYFKIPDAGHAVLWENPECDLALIKVFLEKGITDELDGVYESSSCAKKRGLN